MMHFLEKIISIKGYVIAECRDKNNNITKRIEQSNLWLDNGYKKIVANETGVYIIISDNKVQPSYTDINIPNLLDYSSPTTFWEDNLRRRLFIGSFSTFVNESREIHTIGLSSTITGEDAWCYTTLHTPIIQKPEEILYVYYYIYFPNLTTVIKGFGKECLDNFCKTCMVTQRENNERASIISNVYYPNSNLHTFINNVPLLVDKYNLSSLNVVPIKDKFKLTFNTPVIPVTSLIGIWTGLSWNNSIVMPNIPFPIEKFISRVWAKKKESNYPYFDIHNLPLGSTNAMKVVCDKTTCTLKDNHYIEVEIMKGGKIEQGEFIFSDTISTNLMSKLINDSSVLGSVTDEDDTYIFTKESLTSMYIWSKSKGVIVNKINFEEQTFYHFENDKSHKCLPVITNSLKNILIIPSNFTMKFLICKKLQTDASIFTSKNWTIHTVTQKFNYVDFLDNTTLYMVGDNGSISFLNLNTMTEVDNQTLKNYVIAIKDNQPHIKPGTIDENTTLTFTSTQSYVRVSTLPNATLNSYTGGNLTFTPSSLSSYSLMSLYKSNLSIVDNKLNITLNPSQTRERLHHIFNDSNQFEITTLVELTSNTINTGIGLSAENIYGGFASIVLTYENTNTYKIISSRKTIIGTIESKDVTINQPFVYLRMVRNIDGSISTFYSLTPPTPSSWILLIPNNTPTSFLTTIFISAGLHWYNFHIENPLIAKVHTYGIPIGNIDRKIQSIYVSSFKMTPFVSTDQLTITTTTLNNNIIIASHNNIVVLNKNTYDIIDQQNLTIPLNYSTNTFIQNMNNKVYIIHNSYESDTLKESKIYYWSNISNKLLYLKSENTYDYGHFFNCWKTGEKLIYNYDSNQQKWMVGKNLTNTYKITSSNNIFLYPGLFIYFQNDLYSPDLTLSTTDKYTFTYVEKGFIKDNMQSISNLGFNLYFVPTRKTTQIQSITTTPTFTLNAYTENTNTWLTADFDMNLYDIEFMTMENIPKYLSIVAPPLTISLIINSTTFQINSYLVSDVFDFYVGYYVRMKTGNCINQIRCIKNYNSITKQFILENSFNGTLQVGDEFEICKIIKGSVTTDPNVTLQSNQIYVNEKTGVCKVSNSDLNSKIKIEYVYLLREIN